VIGGAAVTGAAACAGSRSKHCSGPAVRGLWGAGCGSRPRETTLAGGTYLPALEGQVALRGAGGGTPADSGGVSPCSVSVSLTVEIAASGTGRIPRGGGVSSGFVARLFETSVVAARRASDRSGSIEPSSWRTSRPASFAFWIAPRESPTRPAYWRSLSPFIGSEKAMSRSTCLLGFVGNRSVYGADEPRRRRRR